MRVCMVTGEEFPPDIRIEKEANSLVEQGHEVFICTPTAARSSTQNGGYHVVECGEPLSGISALGGRLRAILKIIKPQIIHVQDTPASLNGLLAAKSLRLRVIFDIHEIWPSLVVENSPFVTHKEIFWSESLQIKELSTCFGANATLTVVEEAQEYYGKRYPFLGGHVTSVCNFESQERFKNIRPSGEIHDIDAFKVTYVGGVDGPIRGLEEVIISAGLLSKENVRFLVVGGGRHLARLQSLVRELKLSDAVKFLGPRSFREAMEIASGSDLCIVPHKKGESTDNTLPHKISQYMHLNKPVISTDLLPIKRLFNSAYFPWEPRTAQKLASLILSLMDDPKLREETLSRARELVTKKYRWKDEAKKLLQIYETLGTS